jgi:hypothetical protein
MEALTGGRKRGAEKEANRGYPIGNAVACLARGARVLELDASLRRHTIDALFDVGVCCMGFQSSDIQEQFSLTDVQRFKVDHDARIGTCVPLTAAGQRTRQSVFALPCPSLHEE